MKQLFHRIDYFEFILHDRSTLCFMNTILDLFSKIAIFQRSGSNRYFGELF